MTFDDAKLVASQRVQRLRQMFQDGKASPYDVDIYGNILLHLATQYMTIYPTDRSMNKQDHLNLSMYLVGQIQLLGVPVNEANNSGDTILHLVIHLKGWDYDENIKQNLPLCVTGLMDLGAELPSIEYPSLRSTHLYLGHLMTKIIDMAEECNSISLAILRKSEDDLRRALTLSLSSINKVNNTGQSALHLAVEWPRGMELLLQAGANVDCKDCHNQSPLVYAIEMSLVEPMKLLARTDCSLLDTYSQVLLKRAIEIEDIAGLNRTQVTAAEMVVNLLVDMVVGRRQRLYDLATSALPVSDLDRLCRESYLPDESASQLYLALLRHGTAVPLALDPGKNRDTLFHQIRYSTRVAERLWKSGFRDINGRNSFGLTPLMHCGLHFPGIMKIWMEYAAWLVEKGADFYAKHDLTLYCEHKRIEYRSESQLVSATPLHFFAYCFGIISHVTARSRLRNWVEESHFESSKEMLQRVLMDNDSDACMCACSISGCTPFTVFTKSYKSVRYMEVSLVDLWPIAKNVCGPSKISNFLRMMTFKKLGMTHTCCYFNHGVFRIKEKAEIDEIRDEEAEDLQKLEELLAEFEAKRNELDIPFEDFIKEYWQPRMKEVLKEGTLDEDALREIGVKVH